MLKIADAIDPVRLRFLITCRISESPLLTTGLGVLAVDSPVNLERSDVGMPNCPVLELLILAFSVHTGQFVRRL
jgi:hypothetical protein